MTNIDRKQFLLGMSAAGVVSLCSQGFGADKAAAPANDGRVWIPHPPKPWSQSTRLIGDRTQRSLTELKGKAPSYDRLPLYNDFCLVQDSAGRWHCIGILFEGSSARDFRQDRLFHYVASSVQGPYTTLGYLDLAHGKESGVWAPFIVRTNARALMYYANPNQSDISIRVAETDDPELRSWRKGADGKEVMVSEPGARDPQIIQERSTGRYLMYYVASMKSGAEWKNIVRVRMSSDLLSWSEPHTVLGTPPGYVAAESVFVLEKNGYYYMWISGFDYARMSLYVSTDPLNFGDAEASRIEEQSGHAPEIVQADGQYWMACVAIASVPGLSNGKDLPIAQHDLEGVYLQQLEWKEADESALKKITRRVG